MDLHRDRSRSLPASVHQTEQAAAKSASPYRSSVRGQRNSTSGVRSRKSARGQCGDAMTAIVDRPAGDRALLRL
jgi:hypothetical protein